jgi:hypothetical protein
MQSKDEVVVSVDGQSLTIAFDAFIRGKFEPAVFAEEFLAAWFRSRRVAATADHIHTILFRNRKQSRRLNSLAASKD